MTGVPGSENSSDGQQLDAAAAVLDQRREPAADAAVDPHLRIVGVDRVHVVALFVGDHLDGQLVVVAQEQRPLRGGRELGRLVEDLGDGVPILLAQRHEHARHQREVERHVAFVAVAEVRADVGRPLVRFREQHAVRVRGVELAPHPLQHVVRLRQVLVAGALAHAQVGDRVEPQRVDAAIEPEPQHVDHRLDDRRVVVIEIGLMREEAVPVVLAGDRIPGPVRLLGVGEDDPRLGKLLVGVAPDVEVALGRSGRRVARALEPRMLVRGVVDDQLDQDLEAARVRGVDEGG